MTQEASNLELGLSRYGLGEATSWHWMGFTTTNWAARELGLGDAAAGVRVLGDPRPAGVARGDGSAPPYPLPLASLPWGTAGPVPVRNWFLGRCLDLSVLVATGVALTCVCQGAGDIRPKPQRLRPSQTGSGVKTPHFAECT